MTMSTNEIDYNDLRRDKADSIVHDDPESICDRARALWLQESPATTTTTLDSSNEDFDGSQQSIMTVVEKMYRSVWIQNDTKIDADANYQHYAKKIKLEANDSDNGHNTNDNNDDNCDRIRRNAGEKLALLLLQSGRSIEADQILSSLGYTCRLADKVINYPCDRTFPNSNVECKDSDHHPGIPCRVYNNFVSQQELDMLQAVFMDPTNDYWSDHNYSVEPPSPYFSYLIPLLEKEIPINERGIFAFVYRLQNVLEKHFAVKHATYCEMWAHNRYHATGHQFHFDSDNEGCTESIRNPICSCIIYLSDSSYGGPSVITNQRLTSNTLATKGWMCHPALGRMVVFDGKVLHGVIPGKCVVSEPKNSCDNNSTSTYIDSNHHGRRVSIMFAFWRKIRVRDPNNTKIVGGAARSFPTEPIWAQQLRNPSSTIKSSSNRESTTVANSSMIEPIPLDHIYVSTSTGRPWTRSMGMPNYEEVFQGF